MTEPAKSEEPDPDQPLRGDFPGSGYRRVSHGLHLLVRDGMTGEEERRRDLRAWLEVLPEDAVFTHVTGAELLGWQLPKLPEQVPVFVAVRGDVKRPRRPGLICSRLTHPATPVERNGLPVDSPAEILLRASRDLGVLDVVIMLDSALRLGHVTRQDIEDVLATRRPGVAVLRHALELCDPGAESGGESVLHVAHRAFDVPVRSQAEIHDDAGGFVARVDLMVVGTRMVHEYDGAGHRTGAQHKVDLRRERRLLEVGLVRRGYTLDDLLNHPRAMLQELDRALGRSHRPRLLDTWQALVDNSMYSAGCRARVMNRWRRLGGIVEWSRTGGRRG